MNNTAADLAMYRPFFRAALRRAQAWQAEYERDVDAWYLDGEGADPDWQTEVDEDGEVHTWNAGGRGYTYPNCIHGMSRWTDYDNICGGCEDGSTVIQLAQGEARSSFRRYTERMNWLNTAPASIPQELRSQIVTMIFQGVNL